MVRTYRLRPRGKTRCTVELRVVVAAVLAVAADAVLAAHHLPKRFAHLVTALARLHVRNLARRNCLEAGSTREKKGRGGAEIRKKLLVGVWHGKQEMLVARARVSRTGK